MASVVKIKLILKQLFLTRYGWYSIILSNLVWSTFWLVPLVYGFLIQDPTYYVVAGSIYVFFAQPLIPMWIIIPLTAVWILKQIFKKELNDTRN